MKKMLFTFSVFLFFSFTTNTVKKEWEVKKSGSIIAIDKLGNAYQATNKQLLKYNSKGKQYTAYSVLNKGEISSIDARNSLQTLLFFKEQQEIILLDNMLGEFNKIDLRSYYEWVDLVCLANRDNAFWLYTTINQELIKTDKNLNVISKTKNLAQALSVNLKPTQLLEVNETIYLFDPTNGLFIFDLFGNYKKQIKLKGATKIKVIGNVIYYLRDSNIEYYDLTIFDRDTLFKSKEKIIDFAISKTNLYIQTTTSFSSYTILNYK